MNGMGFAVCAQFFTLKLAWLLGLLLFAHMIVVVLALRAYQFNQMIL